MSVYVLCVNSIMFILSICSILLTLCFVFVFILFSVLPYGEIKLCIKTAILNGLATGLPVVIYYVNVICLKQFHEKAIYNKI